MNKKGIVAALLPGAVAFSLVAAACTAAPADQATTGTTGGVNSQQAQAVATQAAPTVVAIATQAAPQVRAAGTAVANAPVRITDLRASANDVTFRIQNASNQQVDTSGWLLRVGNQSFQMPMAANLAPGASITVHTGRGTDSKTDVYLGGEITQIMQAFASEPSVAIVDPNNQVVSQVEVPQALLNR